MWVFEEPGGGRWDVVLGRESWGALYALFVPKGGGEVRQTQLAASSHEEAQREVDEGGPAGLLALFRKSRPKEQ